MQNNTTDPHTPATESDVILTGKQAAFLLGVSIGTVRRLYLGGHLPMNITGTGANTRWHIRLSTVLALRGQITQGTFDLRPYQQRGRPRGRTVTPHRGMFGSARIWVALAEINTKLDQVTAALLPPRPPQN